MVTTCFPPSEQTPDQLVIVCWGMRVPCLPGFENIARCRVPACHIIQTFEEIFSSGVNVARCERDRCRGVLLLEFWVLVQVMLLPGVLSMVLQRDGAVQSDLTEQSS